MSQENPLAVPADTSAAEHKKEPIHTWSFESIPSKAIDAADIVEAAVADHGWTKEQLGELKLVVQETLVNTMLHGNGSDPSKKAEVELNFTTDENGEEMAEVTIMGEGKGFNPTTVPDPTEGEGLLKSSGRGALIMKYYSDVDPEFFPGEDKVLLRWKKNRPIEKDSGEKTNSA